MKKTPKRISILLSALLLHQNSNSAAVEVGKVFIDKEIYEITKEGKKIGSFRIEKGKLLKTDEGVEFLITLKDMPENIEKIESERETVKIEKDNGTREGKVVRIKVEEKECRNAEFYSYKQLNFVKTNGEKVLSEELKFTVKPDVSITTSKDSINFGTLTYNNGYIFGAEQSFTVNYTILDDAKCKIHSAHNFRLKHRSLGCFIPYKLNSSSNITSDGVDKYFDLPSKKNSTEIRVGINEFMNVIPMAGDYEDNIVLTVVPRE